jgi:hypothetical protein
VQRLEHPPDPGGPQAAANKENPTRSSMRRQYSRMLACTLIASSLSFSWSSLFLQNRTSISFNLPATRVALRRHAHSRWLDYTICGLVCLLACLSVATAFEVPSRSLSGGVASSLRYPLSIAFQNCCCRASASSLLEWGSGWSCCWMRAVPKFSVDS